MSSQETHAHFVPNLMAVDFDVRDRDDRRRGLERAAEAAQGRLATRADLRERFRRDEEEELVDRVGRFVDFALVDNPVEAARAAMAADPRVTASPVHELGFQWHALYSATKAEKVEDVTFPALPPGDRDRVIAVVDTGVVTPEALPEWMSSSIVAGADDVEVLHKDAVSHGTFVTSLLRQIAPSHAVSMARAGGLDDGDGTDPNHPLPSSTTELHIAAAIDRLIERHRGACVVEALNLSVGGPTEEDLIMLTLQQAIAKWRDVFPKTPIFAAAGNTPDPDTIYPAAFRYVRGVAAAGSADGQIVWKEDDTTVDPPAREWVDDIAPGAGLVGVGGRSPDDTIKWSGSSFAAAVATASYVNGGPVEVAGGLAYWPNRAMHYGDVPGLRFA
jgi:hypothetical protein